MRRWPVILLVASCALPLVALAIGRDLGLPPVRLIRKYGFPPAGGPTGRTMEIEGVRFVEIGPGYFRPLGYWLDFGGHLPRVAVWRTRPGSPEVFTPEEWHEFTRPYWIAVTEVTNRQYERYDPGHVRDAPSADAPVTSVRFDDAEGYCRWLSTRGELDVRLPTENEWENSCRAGSKGEFCFDEETGRASDYGWFLWNSDGHVHDVATLRPNAWGLYDMHGNVEEWCRDAWYVSVADEPDDNPHLKVLRGSISPDTLCRVTRDGGWCQLIQGCTWSFRTRFDPDSRRAILGFRPAATSR